MVSRIGYGYGLPSRQRRGPPGVPGETAENTQLSPEATSINLTLTSDKKGGRKTADVATWQSARTSVAASGKVYFEAEATVLSGLQEAAFGLMNSTFTLAGDEPGGANSAAYQSVGRSGDEGVFTAQTAFVEGERVMFAYDSGNGKFWIGRLGVWVGDPAAGTGEAGIITSAVYPGISLKTLGGEIYLYLSAADWLYSAPAGWGSLANPGEAAAAATDPNFANVTFLAGFESGLVDESNTGHTITAVSANASVSSADAKFGAQSVFFNVTASDDSQLTTPASTDFDFGSGQFTVEAFIKRTVTGGRDYYIGYFGASSLWALYRDNGILTFIRRIGGSSLTLTYNWSGFILDTWYHVCADRDASGVIRLYIDGVMVASVTDARSIDTGGTELRIGRSGSVYELHGYMDEIRVTKGVARYASDAGFTVPSEAFPRA